MFATDSSMVYAEQASSITTEAQIEKTESGLQVVLTTQKNDIVLDNESYLYLHHIREFDVLDEISSANTSTLNTDRLQHKFTINVPVQTDDRFVLMVRNKNGIPIHVEPVTVEITNQIALTDTQTKSVLQIASCDLDSDKQNLECQYTYNGQFSDQITFTLFKDTVFGSVVQTYSETPVVIQNQQQDVLQLPVRGVQELSDGLYPYRLSLDSGRQIYQKSMRVGDNPSRIIKNNESQTTVEDPATSDSNMLMTIITIIVLAITVMLVAFFLQKKKKITAGLVLLAAVVLVGAYWAASISFDSADYPQYQYNIYTTPIAGDQYNFVFSAYDTYAAAAPVLQQVEITYDGENYSSLINSNTSQSSHVRQIAISNSQASTTAIRVVDGCASYYDATIFGQSRFGKRDCTPVPLFASLGTAVGCMDPLASNYNPLAIISDEGSCAYLGCTVVDSVNYDPNATVDDGSCQACQWLPQLPDMTQICTFESVAQTNNCTSETRIINGTKSDLWVPNITPNEVCLGATVTQTRECSGLTPDPVRTVTGTSNDPFCVLPVTDYEVSTNLQNWTSCAAGDIKFTRSDQVLYVRPTGSEPASSWSVSQLAGEITGSAQIHNGTIWKIDFAYPVERKTYSNVEITMNSPAGNTSTQSCNISLLNFDFSEQ